MAKKISAIGVLLVLLSSVSAAENDGWINLFNGKDLSGWNQVNGKAIYEVIDGEIVGTTVASDIELPTSEDGWREMTPLDFPRNSFIATEKIYTDFVFEVELFAGNMNGGIQFRSNIDPDYWEGLVHGYQAEVDPSERAWSAGIFDEMRRGWLYPVSFNPKARAAFKTGDWNLYRIEAIGNSLRTWLNGVPVAHVIDDMSPEGFIALQVHFIMGDQGAGEQIRWRNIRIKTENLSPAPPEDMFVANYLPNNLSEAEKRQGWRLLFDGNATAEWKSTDSDNPPSEDWISNGGESIQTSDSFEAFDFQFEFAADKGASGGITYFSRFGEPASGFEYLIVPDNRGNGTENPGSLSGVIPAEKLGRHPGAPYEQKWKRGRIIAYPGGKVEHWLNGKLVLEYTRSSDEFNALLAGSEHAGLEGLGTEARSPIAIRGQEGTVRFRSLKIRKLD